MKAMLSTSKSSLRPVDVKSFRQSIKKGSGFLKYLQNLYCEGTVDTLYNNNVPIYCLTCGTES